MGARHHPRPPGADVRGAERRLVSRRARRAALQAAAERGRRCTACSARTRRSRRSTGRRAPRCASRSASLRDEIDARAGAVARAGRPAAHARRGRGRRPTCCAALACQRSDAARAAARPRQLRAADDDRRAASRPTRRSWICSGTTARSHVPVLRLLAAPTVPARCYHAVATGYAGLLAALWSHRTGRPLMVTEHGIYARERDMELARADWIRDDGGRRGRAALDLGAARLAAAPALVVVLPRAVAHRLRAGARHRHAVARSTGASRSPTARRPRRSTIVPNGVDAAATPRRRRGAAARRRRRRVIALPARAPARRLRGPGGADQGPGHLRPRLRPRARAASIWTCA